MTREEVKATLDEFGGIKDDHAFVIQVILDAWSKGYHEGWKDRELAATIPVPIPRYIPDMVQRPSTIGPLTYDPKRFPTTARPNE